MNVGGVEKSFLNLVDGYDREKYELHLGLFSVSGGLLEDVPSDVTIHHIDIYDRYHTFIADPPQVYIKDLLRNGQFIEATRHLFFALVNKYFHTRMSFYRHLLRNEPDFPIDCDIAIAYASPSEVVDYYVGAKVNAPKKYAWIHFDIRKVGINPGIIRHFYPKFEKIVIVSQAAKQHFDNLFPNLSNKTLYKPNIVSHTLTQRMSETAKTFDDGYEGLKILTVGRISHEKGQDIAIQAAKILKDYGLGIRWYFVGDGVFTEKCKSMVKAHGLEQEIVFLGLKKNPYGYMRDCDIYVQPSRHEGFCITLAEALCFNKPIVSTDFSGAREQLRDNERAVICDTKAQSIADSVVRLINR